jgi:lysophospholipase L1-like esterase
LTRAVGGPLAAALAVAVSATLAGCGRDAATMAGCSLPSGATVLAIGDSLTRGHGAPGNGYAEQLQALLPADISVVNAGIDGERSEGLLQRIDAALDEHRPAVVLITTGGNDFLRRVPDDQTRRNVAAIVDRVRDQGATPVLFGIPRASLTAAAGLLSEHELYEDLAEDGVPVIRDVVTRVLSDEALKADRIHPNASGYARLAQAAQQALAGCR